MMRDRVAYAPMMIPIGDFALATQQACRDDNINTPTLYGAVLADNGPVLA